VSRRSHFLRIPPLFQPKFRGCSHWGRSVCWGCKEWTPHAK